VLNVGKRLKVRKEDENEIDADEDGEHMAISIKVNAGSPAGQRFGGHCLGPLRHGDDTSQRAVISIAAGGDQQDQSLCRGGAISWPERPKIFGGN